MPHTPRHARRRVRPTAVLPALLIAAAGSALAGMAALPGPASADSHPEAARALAVADVPVPPPPTARAEAAELAASVAQERRGERASRTRTPVLPAAPVVPAPAPPPVAPPPVAPPVVAPPVVAPPVVPPPVVAPPPPPPPPQFVRPGTGRLTSGYGSRWGRLHAGIDLAAGVGAPISAVAAGTVAAAGSEGGYGRAVRVQHDDGTVTLYAHLSEVLVSAGQRVTAGTYLGREGSTGNSTGPHLHFEVRVGGVAIDPAPWLRARGVDPAAH